MFFIKKLLAICLRVLLSSLYNAIHIKLFSFSNLDLSFDFFSRIFVFNTISKITERNVPRGSIFKDEDSSDLSKRKGGGNEWVPTVNSKCQIYSESKGWVDGEIATIENGKVLVYYADGYEKEVDENDRNMIREPLKTNINALPKLETSSNIEQSKSNI